MSQPLREEDPERTSLITSRTQQSKLWFVNAPKLERAILGQLAKLQERHEFILYAFQPMGNHYHKCGRYPNSNRAGVMRDFNSGVQRLVKAFVPRFEGGTLFERRYAEQALPTEEDVEEYFWYCALQVIAAGLVSDLRDFPGYCFFFDAIEGREREFELINWTKYYIAKRFRRSAKPEEFVERYPLRYSRLPGYEHLSQEEYARVMLEKYEVRRKEIIEERREKGLGFLTPAQVLRVVAGSKPRVTKTSSRFSYRPLVLSLSREAKRAFLEHYFSLLENYKIVSARFRAGDCGVVFPPLTYKPSLCLSP